MNNNIYMLLILLFLGPLGSTGAPPAAFSNGDFETWTGTLPDGWTNTTSGCLCTVIKGTTNAHSGTNLVILDPLVVNVNWVRLIFVSVDVSAGTQYTFSVWIIDNAAKIDVTATVNDGGSLSTSAAYTDGPSWQQISVTFTTGGGTSSVDAFIQATRAGGGAGDTVDVDLAEFIPTIPEFNVPVLLILGFSFAILSLLIYKKQKNKS